MTAPLPRRRRPRLSFLERRWLLSGKPGALPYLEGGKWAQREASPLLRAAVTCSAESSRTSAQARPRRPGSVRLGTGAAGISQDKPRYLLRMSAIRGNPEIICSF
jgi:hypothetical protein